MYRKILPGILAISMAATPIAIYTNATNIATPKNTNITNTTTPKYTNIANITIQQENPATKEYDTTIGNFNVPINNTNKPQEFYQEKKIPAKNIGKKHTNPIVLKISGYIMQKKLDNTTILALCIATETYQHQMSIDIPYFHTFNIVEELKNKSDSLTFFSKNKEYKITVTNKQLLATSTK